MSEFPADKAKMVEWCKTRLKSSVLSAWQVGRALNHVKKSKVYGDWLPFLKAVDISAPTANRYRKLAKRFEKETDLPNELMKAYRMAGILSWDEDDDEDEGGEPQANT